MFVRCILNIFIQSHINKCINSNDLDVDTIRSLEEALLEFAGCALVVRLFQFFIFFFSSFFLQFFTFLFSHDLFIFCYFFKVSHDRFFLDRICTHILAYEGNSEIKWFTGNYQEYEAYKKESAGESIPKPITYAPLVSI